MPVRTDLRTLKQILQPGVTVRSDSESRIDVTHDKIRLQAVSEDKTVSVDYTLPTSCPTLSVDDADTSFWIPVERVNRMLRASPDSPVTLKLPTETSKFLLESGCLSYRLSPLNSRFTHRISEDTPNEPQGEGSIRHGVFARAVRAADLLGEDMKVQLLPSRSIIKLSATNNYNDDAFSYSLPASQINRISGSASTLTISIDRLRDIVKAIPRAARVSLKFHPPHLTYRVKYPVTGANLTMRIANRRGTVQ